jgi:predicted DNA binding CopG/RHH family protein
VKRIIDGVTYDTDTATQVFSDVSDNPFSLGYWGMFQTRHGAFFKVVCGHDGETYTFTPLTDDDARKLLERHANHLVEQYFGQFPEYGSAEKRLTIRIPIGLARRVEAAAANLKLDVNKYVQRTLEKSVTSDGQPPTFI